MKIENDETRISYDNTTIIFKPNEPNYYPISESDWTRLKKKINSCQSNANWWMNGGFCSAGVCGSALVSWLALPIESEKAHIPPLLISTFIFTLIIAIICFVAHYAFNKVHISKIEDVKDVVNEIDNSFTSCPQEE